MKKKYQKLKKRCIAFVVFALLIVFTVPYDSYAADSEAETATEMSVVDNTGAFYIPEQDDGETIKEQESELAQQETEITEQEQVDSTEKSSSDENIVGENTELENESTSSLDEQTQILQQSEEESSKEELLEEEDTQQEKQELTAEEIKEIRKNLQLGRSYNLYVDSAKEKVAVQSDSDGIQITAQSVAETLKPDINTVLYKVHDYILKKDTKPEFSSLWNVIGLKRSGLDVPKSYTDLFYSNVIAYCESKDWELSPVRYTDYSKLILALTAIGVDARNVMGHNLLYYLSDYENVSMQGNNGPMWALIALNSNVNYINNIPKNDSAVQQTTEALLIKKILEMQCTDGGWNLSKTGSYEKVPSKGDSDMTGMAIQALSFYYNKDGYENVTQAINKGLDWISKNQMKSGGFGTGGAETSESVAQIITALSGLKIDSKKDSRFIKDGKWPMTGLFQYYMAQGGFMHVAAGAGNNGGGIGGEINGMATEQGFYATVAYQRMLNGKTFLYDMNDVEIKPGKTPTVKSTIGTDDLQNTATKKTETQPVPAKVKVITVRLNYSTIYLKKGKSKKLKVTISPTNAANKTVKWTSSNKKIATVDAKGKVTAKKAGKVRITAKAKDGSGKKAVCKVIVKASGTATATTEKKKVTSSKVTTKTQTKKVTTPSASGTTKRVAGTSVQKASGTTKSLPASENTAAKTSAGTTVKKKDTKAEETTGNWSFSGDNYVPDTYSAEDEATASEANTETENQNGEQGKRENRSTAFYIAGGVGGLATVEALGFITYKKRRNIANVLRKFRKDKNEN